MESNTFGRVMAEAGERRLSGSQCYRIQKALMEPVIIMSSRGGGIPNSFRIVSRSMTFTVELHADGSFACSCDDYWFTRIRRIECACQHVCSVFFHLFGHEHLGFFETRRLDDEQRSTLLDRNIANLMNALERLNRASSSGPCFRLTRPLSPEDACPICLDAVQSPAGSSECPTCKTVFHDACASRWTRVSETCAYCRSPLWSLWKKKR